jgi:hypothetical protein
VTRTPAPGNELAAPVFVAGIDALAPRTPGKATPQTVPPNDRRINRMQATAAEKRTDRDHNLGLKARRKELARTEKAARTEQRRSDRDAGRAARKARRAERITQHSEHFARLQTFTISAGRRLMVIGPILAPMAVAWSSQTSYAMTAFGWPLIFALGFAAAWELSTTFTGWMYHQARKSGDRGIEYRLLTWIFALGAAAMNYAHHAGPHGAPTQASIAFSAMSITGMVLWESYARLVHRKWLREQGLVPRARPRLGLVRWLRYPVHAFTAWSLAILCSDLDTADKAWTAAADNITETKRQRETARAEKAARRKTRETKQRETETKTDARRKSRRGRSPQKETGAETAVSLTKTTAQETGTSRNRSPRSSETTVRETGHRETETNRAPGAAETEASNVSPIGDRETETSKLLDLMRSRGSQMKVSLNDAITETGRPKATAAKRLKAARDQYLAETA